jgi:fluoroacetyl-CoA thioesterase
MSASSRANLQPGAKATATHAVTSTDTAKALGSGDLAVLGTPRLLAWMEGATCQVVSDHIDQDETSVGTRITVEHLKASPVGAAVRIVAQLVHADGRLLRFEVSAEHGDGSIVGHGEITRVVVDAERFLARLPS